MVQRPRSEYVSIANEFFRSSSCHPSRLGIRRPHRQTSELFLLNDPFPFSDCGWQQHVDAPRKLRLSLQRAIHQERGPTPFRFQRRHAPTETPMILRCRVNTEVQASTVSVAAFALRVLTPVAVSRLSVRAI